MKTDQAFEENRGKRGQRVRKEATPGKARDVQVTVTLAALLLGVHAAGPRPVIAAGPATLTNTTVNLHATVVERTSLKIQHQIPHLVITRKDVQQGYADVPEGTMFEVKSNNPLGYLLYFESLEGPTYNYFNAINVIADGKEVQLSPSGGYILKPYVRDGVRMKVSYRFLLSQNAKPGTYSWPLVVSVAPR